MELVVLILMQISWSLDEWALTRLALTDSSLLQGILITIIWLATLTTLVIEARQRRLDIDPLRAGIVGGLLSALCVLTFGLGLPQPVPDLLAVACLMVISMWAGAHALVRCHQRRGIFPARSCWCLAAGVSLVSGAVSCTSLLLASAAAYGIWRLCSQLPYSMVAGEVHRGSAL